MSSGVYGLRKEPDKMFGWLERAYTERDPALRQLLATPFILDYRDDPRFVAFCQKLKVQNPAARRCCQAMSDRLSFFSELKRRNMIRVAGLYLVGAWLLNQVASTVLPTFDVPTWALRGLIITLGLGFLPALIFSWGSFYFARWNLGMALDLKGSIPEAMAEYQKASELSGDLRVDPILTSWHGDTGFEALAEKIVPAGVLEQGAASSK